MIFLFFEKPHINGISFAEDRRCLDCDFRSSSIADLQNHIDSTVERFDEQKVYNLDEESAKNYIERFGEKGYVIGPYTHTNLSIFEICDTRQRRRQTNTCKKFIV